MKKLLGTLLALGLPCAANAQTTPPTSDLRQLVEAMQKVAKPTISSPMPPGSISTIGNAPLLVLLNNTPVPLDSLDRYTLRQALSVTLNLHERVNTALYGSRATWGIIEVKTNKSKPN